MEREVRPNSRRHARSGAAPSQKGDGEEKAETADDRAILGRVALSEADHRRATEVGKSGPSALAAAGSHARSITGRRTASPPRCQAVARGPRARDAAEGARPRVDGPLARWVRAARTRTAEAGRGKRSFGG